MRFIKFLIEAPFAKKTYDEKPIVRKRAGTAHPAKKPKDHRSRWVKDIVEVPGKVSRISRGDDDPAPDGLPYTEDIKLFVPVNKWRDVIRQKAVQKLPTIQNLTSEEYDDITSAHGRSYTAREKLPDKLFHKTYGYKPFFKRTKSGALRLDLGYQECPIDMLEVFFGDAIQKQVDRIMTKRYSEKAAGWYELNIYSQLGNNGYKGIWKKLTSPTLIKNLREKWKEVNAEVYRDLDQLQTKLNTSLDSNTAKRKVILGYQAEIRQKLKKIVADVSSPNYPIQITGFSFSPTSASSGTTQPGKYNTIHSAGRTKQQQAYSGHFYDFISVRMKLSEEDAERFRPKLRQFQQALKTEFANAPYALDYHGWGWKKGVRLLMHGVEVPKAVREKSI